ncbi:actin-binding protein WASF1-like isoform X2 [Rattus norvegicus]|uniref:actin-binding protein WASF1-like isoform X2 n=1 Tax=Rattus norvegicus TaxID=10116 RepID=UPI0003D0BE15|nr:wiskott-Aldrich syndrome protein family member 1-like isoform X2 [Rattus norvegicus]
MGLGPVFDFSGFKKETDILNFLALLVLNVETFRMGRKEAPAARTPRTLGLRSRARLRCPASRHRKGGPGIRVRFPERMGAARRLCPPLPGLSARAGGWAGRSEASRRAPPLPRELGGASSIPQTPPGLPTLAHSPQSGPTLREAGVRAAPAGGGCACSTDALPGLIEPSQGGHSGAPVAQSVSARYLYSSTCRAMPRPPFKRLQDPGCRPKSPVLSDARRLPASAEDATAPAAAPARARIQPTASG